MSKIERVIRQVTINGRKRDLVAVDDGDFKQHYEVDGVNFDGHWVDWGFEYKPESYLKESELSGDEWRKGGSIKIFRNGVCVMEDFCREPLHAAAMMYSKLIECQEFMDWDGIEVGRKVYYREVPAIIKSILSEGRIVLKPESGMFPPWAYELGDSELGVNDEKDSLVAHVTERNIWWWRK